MSRQSVWPTNDGALLTYLDEVVNYTEASGASLGAALSKLAPGIADLPRLSKVLVNKHHYLVLPATQVQSHQSALSHSLAPQIEALIAKAEVVVSSQAKRVTNLEERLEIVRSAARQQLGAAAQASVSAGATAAAGAGADETQEADDADVGRSKLDGLEMRELTVAQRRKVVMLRGKRDRLEREWRELTEEDDQA